MSNKKHATVGSKLAGWNKVERPAPASGQLGLFQRIDDGSRDARTLRTGQQLLFGPDGGVDEKAPSVDANAIGGDCGSEEPSGSPCGACGQLGGWDCGCDWDSPTQVNLTDLAAEGLAPGRAVRDECCLGCGVPFEEGDAIVLVDRVGYEDPYCGVACARANR